MTSRNADPLGSEVPTIVDPFAWMKDRSSWESAPPDCSTLATNLSLLAGTVARQYNEKQGEFLNNLNFYDKNIANKEEEFWWTVFEKILERFPSPGMDAAAEDTIAKINEKRKAFSDFKNLMKGILDEIRTASKSGKINGENIEKLREYLKPFIEKAVRIKYYDGFFFVLKKLISFREKLEIALAILEILISGYEYFKAIMARENYIEDSKFIMDWRRDIIRKYQILVSRSMNLGCEINQENLSTIRSFLYTGNR